MPRLLMVITPPTKVPRQAAGLTFQDVTQERLQEYRGKMILQEKWLNQNIFTRVTLTILYPSGDHRKRTSEENLDIHYLVAYTRRP